MRNSLIAGFAILAIASCDREGTSPIESDNAFEIDRYTIPQNNGSGISSFRGLGGKSFGGGAEGDVNPFVQDSTEEPYEFSLTPTNPYFPLTVGYQWQYGGVKDGAPINLLRTVLDETRIIDVEGEVDDEPVTFSFETRVVEERWTGPDQELINLAWNYYAQREDGVILLFGRDVFAFQDTNTGVYAGGFCGEPEYPPEPPASARVGDTYVIGSTFYQVMGVGPVSVPFGRVADAVRVREYGIAWSEKKCKDDKKYGLVCTIQTHFTGEVDDRIYGSDVGLLFFEGLPLLNLTRNAPAPQLPPLSDEFSCP